MDIDAITQFFGQGVGANMTNSILQNIIKSYTGHKSYSTHDVFMFLAFNKFIPSFDDLENMEEEAAIKHIEKCNHFAFICADHMACLLEKTKKIEHNETADTAHKKNVKFVKNKNL